MMSENEVLIKNVINVLTQVFCATLKNFTLYRIRLLLYNTPFYEMRSV